MRTVIMLALILLLAGCKASPTALPTTVATSLPTAAAVPISTTVPTPTAVPTSTSTPMPTNTPTSSSTATPEPTTTSTATATPVKAEAWRVPVITAGLTVAVINELDETATALQAGTLASIEAGGRLLGYKVAVATVAQMLEEAELPGREGGYRQALQDNLVGVFRLIDRWQSGEIASATVPAALAPVRAASERTLSEITDELRRLGVSQAQIDEFLAEINAVLEP